MSVIRRVSARVEIFDPGHVRTRRGARAVGATVFAWATMVAVTYAFDVADPVRITLFAAGAAFEGALLAPDPRPRDRAGTLGWAVVVSTLAVILTVALTRQAVWLGAILLVLLMFSSYALRAWSTRIASLALMGAITVYVTGAGHITVGRVGWFVVALALGFGWLAIWESVILRDVPVRSLARSVHAFARRAAETVAAAVDALNTARDGTPPDHAARALRTRLERAKSCRSAIETQFAGAVAHGMSPQDVDRLRVALHSVQKGLEDLTAQVEDPGWLRSLPDEITWSVTSTLHGLAVALADDSDGSARDTVAGRARVLRGHIHGALTHTTESGAAPFPPQTLLAALSLLSAGEIVAQSLTRAMELVSTAAAAVGTAMTPAAAEAPQVEPAARLISPTMALAIQAVVAAVGAGLIAKAVGNEQSLVVAWTAFVVIAGSAGLSARRAFSRLPATILGAVGGVAIAACVPEGLLWTVAVVAIGVFLTIVSAPVSYPAMVFWMSIAFVPLFATEGRYLDLVRDKSVAALIGGCVAAVVALAIVPLRDSREIRPAVLAYLDALDDALESHLPGRESAVAAAEAELDRTHAALTTKFASAATEVNVFSQPAGVRNDKAVHVDAVHEAYLRLTPLLSDGSRQLHGWTDDQVRTGIRQLRDAISAARGDVPAAGGSDATKPVVSQAVGTAELTDSLRRVDQLESDLKRLAVVLNGRADAPPLPQR
ncbi:FUSC family protein [Mycobacterium sp. CPCC 205372]|uniref:FUSC family protein n=2 Tax=Mycobacterium hippophais TaxID=3016340 RepID=A0ABT4PLA8_9MYCO|nr:FUSC family protein [Mycobacterium hippophais]